MKNEKVNGITEAMFGEIVMPLEKFKKLNSKKITKLIEV